MSNKLIFFDFDSTFISVETIDEIATLALAHDQNKEQKIKEITDITNEAMTGKFDFSVALQKRLELLSPTKEHIKEVTQKIMNLVSPSFTRNQEKLKQISDSIRILSGGFTDVIAPIVEPFGIPREHIYANSFIYDNDIVVGCDAENYLTQTEGKVKQLKALNLNQKIIIVGDGYTDYEVSKYGISDTFICYTENIERESVIKRSKHIANSLEQVFEILNI